MKPVEKTNRIQSLDLLRGIAILGILIMNIQSFAMPSSAYNNPLAFGDLSGFNKITWILSHLFADQKFMSIFSILFGTGIVLITEKKELLTGSSVKLHYIRNLILLLIGLIHAHLIWYGDILVAYALCSFIVYPLRKLSPRKLLISGLLIVSVPSFLNGLFQFSLPFMPASELQDLRLDWAPTNELIEQEITAFTGSISSQIKINSQQALFLETFVFLIQFLWRAGGLMLVGMALYRWGVLSAVRSRSFYLKSAFYSLIIGFPIVIYGIYMNFTMNWDFQYSMFTGSQFNYWGSLFIAYGYISLIMVFAQSDNYNTIKKRLASIGQMALTNYILHSFIGMLIFFGIGFGLFGKIDRSLQILIVGIIWIFQYLASEKWLNSYKFGPLEWVWRSLTYGKKQPFLRS
ncbi:DUF418 domain-containing protein [Bacteroidota bacterium]|nr:DUF418 domain-containing protein [Bacteroidota bacterium]